MKQDYKDYKMDHSLFFTAENKRRFLWLIIISSLCTIFYSTWLLVNPNLQASRAEPDNLEQITIPVPLPDQSNRFEDKQTSPVSQALTIQNAQNQISPAPQHEWKTVEVKYGDSLTSIFNRQKLDETLVHKIIQLDGLGHRFEQLKPGDTLSFLYDAKDNLQKLSYDLNDTETLILNYDNNTFTKSIKKTPLAVKTVRRTGTIESSLYLAGQKAGLSDKIIMEMANIFSWDIDFILDIRPKDQFHLVYEELYKNDQKVADGRILIAEFINKDKSYKAVYYKGKNGNGDYYTPEGLSLRKAFIRAPVNFSRISSHFSLGRKHPVLHKIRAHRGVDYAAPRGTPVKAAGDGKIKFFGRKGGYGKTVILQHGRKYRTLYAHLSRYKRGLRVGEKVKQGDVIGYVGSTGLATGPHLHYEFHVNGIHRNPLTVELPKAVPIAIAEKDSFLQHASLMLAELEKASASTIALNSPAQKCGNAAVDGQKCEL